jgi:hypothetical protein
MTVAMPRTASSTCSAAEVRSPTTTSARAGCQRCTWRIIANQLPRPARQGFGPATLSLRGARRGRQHREKGQGPHPRRPWHRDEQHEADPTHPTYLEEVTGARAHRIPLDPSCSDLGATPTRDRFLDAHYERPSRSKRCHQETEQAAAGAPARPDRTAQDALVGLKVRPVTEPDGPEGGADQALTRGELAPASNTCTWRQTGRENSGAKGASSATLSAGRISRIRPPCILVHRRGLVRGAR